jgi:hypothetical protein
VATFKSGAKSSERAPRFDLIPVVALEREARRWAEGAAAHGENNYQRGICTDPEFRKDRENHLLYHVLRYVAGDRSDAHLAAIRCNAGMLEWADAQAAKGYDDARAEPVKCRCGRMVNRPEQCDGPPCPFDRVPHQAVGDATGEPR